MGTDLLEVGIFCEIIGILFVVIVIITLFNMLIGILVETINTTAVAEREAMKTQLAKEHISKVLEDHNFGSGAPGENLKVTKSVFKQMILNHQVVKAVSDLGVDPVDLAGFTDNVFG